MGKIKLLREEIINKIAAGEVVERPASVVKELVENSLDAGATRISVEVRKGGKTFIKVIDDGAGMEEDDLLLALERHATSKIEKEEDIYSITTMGFRGEALPSIAAVSKLTLTSKTADSIEGTQVKVEGGKIKSVSPIACPDGTAVTVRSLFFNTPARAKYLKTDQTETKEIVEVVKNIALAHPQVAFTLVSNNYQVFSTPGDGKTESVVISIFGLKTFEKLQKVDFSSILSVANFSPSPFKLFGFIGRPEDAKSQRNALHFFVNGRYVKSPLLARVVLGAYGPSLPPRRYPLVILHLKLNPELVDVNIHPAKREIKFADEKQIATLVEKAVSRSLQSSSFFAPDLKKSFSMTTPKGNDTFPKETKEEIGKKGSETEAKGDGPSYAQMFFGDFGGEEVSLSKSSKEESLLSDLATERKSNGFSSSLEGFNQAEDETTDFKEKLKKIRIIGQFHLTYILAEYPQGFLLVDQHVAHEKYLFEKFSKSLLEKEKLERQVLLFPALIELNPVDFLAVQESLDKLSDLGIEMEVFGENTFLIKTVPLMLGKVSSKEEVYEIIDFVLKEMKQSDLLALKKELISQMACRQAIKAGEKLTLAQQEELLKKLLELDDPTRCPHGRPIILDFPLPKIEKLFQRI